MRYGEHIDEANANPEWRCPSCRDLCNCSFHRSRRGWAPTGTLYRAASAEGVKHEGIGAFRKDGLQRCRKHRLTSLTSPPALFPNTGYASVSHYLVLNNLAPEAREAALPLMPPELAAETRKALQAEKEQQQSRAPEQEVDEAVALEKEEAAAVSEGLLSLSPPCSPSTSSQAEPASTRRSTRTRRQALLSQVGLSAVKKSRGAPAAASKQVTKALAKALAEGIATQAVQRAEAQASLARPVRVTRSRSVAVSVAA